MLVKRRKWYGAGLTDLMLTATVGVERKLDILRTFVVGSTKLYVLKIVKDIEKSSKRPPFPKKLDQPKYTL